MLLLAAIGDRHSVGGFDVTTMDHLQARFPGIAGQLRKVALADLPTPVSVRRLECAENAFDLWLKEDQHTGVPYGGNKVRKLEYLLQPAIDRQRRLVATFGAVGSHHALATALYAREIGLPCMAFLGHQHRAPSIAATLNMHLKTGTEIVRYGGSYDKRIATLRRHLWGRDAWVIPAGGSSWLGCVGFVNAGLELAAQADAGLLPLPDRVYIAAGTVGSAAGLALGLALAEAPTVVHAVRVTDENYASARILARLLDKTALMLNRLEPGIPADLADRTRIALRHEYFGRGYAYSNEATDEAVELAAARLGLTLETTYTGKAMAALLDDAARGAFAGQRILFWNTYHSAALPVTADRPLDPGKLPEEFLTYFG